MCVCVGGEVSTTVAGVVTHSIAFSPIIVFASSYSLDESILWNNNSHTQSHTLSRSTSYIPHMFTIHPYPGSHNYCSIYLPKESGKIEVVHFVLEIVAELLPHLRMYNNDQTAITQKDFSLIPIFQLVT